MRNSLIRGGTVTATGDAGYGGAPIPAPTGSIEAPVPRSSGRRSHPYPDADRPATRQSRGESTAHRLITIANAASPGQRLGSKDELRMRCGVSVGTFNEAVRIAQSRGVVSVRPGPGGGVFAAAPSAMVRLGNSVLALDDAQTSVAEAVRIRDALDPLLIEDALWHASPADIAEMRKVVAAMATAVDRADPTAFVHANWQLHARIAAVSPHPVLRSLYLTLLDQIESHTLDVLPVSEQPLPDYIAARHNLHAAIVDALDARDHDLALTLIAEHNTSNALPRALVPADDNAGPAASEPR
jgi:DNA-binding FadR family transcriptional regulator